MLSIIGIIVTFIMVFGGYGLAGGKFAVILHALPHEMITICGAVVGAFLVANKSDIVKATLRDFKVIFVKPAWTKDDYLDLLWMLFQICKTMRSKGLLEIEKHLEKPEESELFNQNAKILHDHFALDFIVSTLRLMTMNMDNPYQMDDLLEAQIEKHHHESLETSHALQSVADGLPAIGIVAAVLGVIKTMASIDQPPTILGAMIGGALVGTFLGVFLAYCFIGPMSQKVKAYYDDHSKLYIVIKKVFVAHLQGHAPQISCEMGRSNIPTHEQPTFLEVEEMQQNRK
ncbi:flagellar motor stator protein MotA [Rickettsiales endosymbiont of Stachyamoeba lipophora]|uniref:flagellar motor stator protein MotA n=1 Tax=Rickettsiales endosymbiont of Stachyamoeba lipophora TaxID=2486578 RepID=UPI000F64D0C8|nr:flagellar motor stator protein MotA [Rickettsiales endosymbiont of Stachyamoeba lipophora]AZL15128.1 flagellar motor stator protein MotA [Rickettsiales endosymbiont of Stachyamoeba lipophora]